MSVEIRNLTVTFKNGVTAVDHVNLDIPQGIYGLLGENGAGKTTLMRVLTTVLKPTEGRVTLNGIPYDCGKGDGSREGGGESIRRKIGYLPQEINLYPELTVWECLDYMGELSGIPKNERRRRIEFFLEKTGLSVHQKKKMRQLSGGMKRRAGLVQALLNEPEFLIVDEPTTGLDPEERIRIRNLLADFGENRTVLFSTHVVEDLAATCHRLAIMKKGRILYNGSVQSLLADTKGHVWSCQVKEDEEARKLEREYHVSAKQYVDGGIRLRLLSRTEPACRCMPEEVTLEDAYIYVSSLERV